MLEKIVPRVDMPAQKTQVTGFLGPVRWQFAQESKNRASDVRTYREHSRDRLVEPDDEAW